MGPHGPHLTNSGPDRILAAASAQVREHTGVCSPDLDHRGLTVYFHSDRLGTTDDIYIATRASTEAPFDLPTVVGVISTPMDEGDPSLTGDQRTIVFHRMLDLHIATW